MGGLCAAAVTPHPVRELCTSHSTNPKSPLKSSSKQSGPAGGSGIYGPAVNPDIEVRKQSGGSVSGDRGRSKSQR
ncbi:hypothetical protein VZT92_021783 [Zoarces viviparus]|uniref:Uncharacterized protein n=1 Tax=Zoarces viviparus TaxID=48416 RepID=A0AAW1EA31_ZOAVI